MIYAYVSSLLMWLYMHWSMHAYMAGIYRGCKGKTAKAQKRYESLQTYYAEAERAIWPTYLHFGTILNINHNQWMIPHTL